MESLNYKPMKSSHLSYLSYLCIVLLNSCGLSVKDLQNSEAAQRLANNPIVANSAKSIIGEGFADKYFYFPKSDFPNTPQSIGLSHSEITIPSTNGTSLHGWLIPAKSGIQNAIGTVVYHHGNEGSIGYYVKRIPWLVEENFNVVMYDYRGYGKSTGKITRKGLIDDAAAAIRYTLNRADLKHTKVISYGHSLGGAKSTVAHATHNFGSRLVAAINESSFASYKDMAEIKGGLTARTLTNDSYSPAEHIKKINIPIFLIHGTNDTVIPISQADKLKASASNKSNILYWKIAGASHFSTLTLNNNAARNRLLAMLKPLLN